MAEENEARVWKRSLFGYISTWLLLGVGGFLVVGIANTGFPSQMFGLLVLAFEVWQLTCVAQTVTFLDGHRFRFTSMRGSATVDASDLVSMTSTGTMPRLDLWNVFPLSVVTKTGRVLVTAQLEDLDGLRTAIVLANPTVRM